MKRVVRDNGSRELSASAGDAEREAYALATQGAVALFAADWVAADSAFASARAKLRLSDDDGDDEATRGHSVLAISDRDGFDVDPPNEALRRFHARYGFDEVGTQTLPGGKRVSLQRAPG